MRKMKEKLFSIEEMWKCSLQIWAQYGKVYININISYVYINE